MSKQRLVWADSLKGVLILLVILGHAIQSTLGADCDSDHVWNLIYSFHMPAFIAISGWIAYKGASPNKADTFFSVGRRRFFQLIVPYFIWSLIQLINRGAYTSDKVYSIIIYPDVYYWFLWVLFWISVIFSLSQVVASKLKINEMFFILAACLLLFGVMVMMEIRVLGFQFIAYYFLFYTLGYVLHKYEWKVFSNGAVLIPLALLWFFLAWGWTMHGLPSWVPNIPHVPTALLQYSYRGFTALVAIIVLLGAAPKLLNVSNKLNCIISQIGVVSLGFYVVHMTIMGNIVECIKTLVPNITLWPCVALSFVIATSISYLVVWLLSKNTHTARIFLGKI